MPKKNKTEQPSLEPAEKSARAFEELVQVLEDAVEAGADSVELEWDRGELEVYQFIGSTGIGTNFPKELQADVYDAIVARAGLNRKAKGKMLLRLCWEEYEIRVKESESFGEPIFRLKMKKRGREAGK